MVSDRVKIGAVQQSTELIRRTIMSLATITSAVELPSVFPEFETKVFQSHMTNEFMKGILTRALTGSLLNDETLAVIAKGLAQQASVNAETVISSSDCFGAFDHGRCFYRCLSDSD